MTRLLLDQGLAPRAAALLRERGFDAVHVVELGMERADDVAILARAAADGRACVTLDHDFHTHLATASRTGPSVILLRSQGLDALGQADLIQIVQSRCEEAIRDGAAISANRETIRIRRLPLR